MEVAGIVIGGVGIVALFDNCMNAFHCIDSGRKYGRDYQEAALKVSLIQLRLARWRETVEIVEDSSGYRRSKIQVASDDEVDIVRDLLESIQTRFAELEKASTHHGLRSPPPAMQPTDSSIDALTTRVETLAIARQKTSSFTQKAKWALHDKRKIGGLIASLTEFTSDLVDMFPGSKAKQLVLAKREAEDLMATAKAEEDDDTLVASTMLDRATKEVDPELKKALEAIVKAKSRHTFGDATIRDQAKVQQGDYVAKGYGGRQLGGNHNFGTLNASGGVSVLQGDNYGGKSVFDD